MVLNIKKSVIFAALICMTVLSNSNLVSLDLTEKEISLIKERPEIFCRRDFCLLDTVGDPKSTHGYLFNQGTGLITSLSIKKNKKIKNSGGLWKVGSGKNKKPGVTVVKKKLCILNANLQMEDKYVGYRESAVGQFLERTLDKRVYNKNIFADEFPNYLIWIATLKDKDDLEGFLDYLLYHGVDRQEKKPALFLTFSTDPELKTIERDRKIQEKIKKLFVLVKYTDIETIGVLSSSQYNLTSALQKFEGSKPARIDEGIAQNLVRRVEKYFQEFKVYDMIPWLIGGFITLLFINKFLTPLTSWIPGCPTSKSPWGILSCCSKKMETVLLNDDGGVKYRFSKREVKN